MQGIGSDLRFAWRHLGRNPLFTLTCVTVLAVGIAAVTVTFSALYGVVLRPLPYPHPERLVWISATTDTGADNSVSAMDYYDYRDRCRSFSQLAAQLVWRPGRVLAGGAEPERVTSSKVSGNYFATLGVAPLLGRSFVAAEEVAGGQMVVVVSHALWQRRMGGSPGAIGSALSVDGSPCEVVGVMPSGFDSPRGVDLWFPMQLGGDEETSRGNSNFYIVGRLADGVTPARAQADLDLVATAIAAADPADRKGWGARLQPLHERFFGAVRPTLLMLTGATVLLLLIACANLSSLLLAQVIGRSRELAMRRALGASTWQVARQLLTEALLLAGLGAVAGIALAWAGVRAVQMLGPSALPRLATIGLDLPVLLAALAATVASGVLLGVAPSLHVRRADLLLELRSGGHGTPSGRSLRLRALLVGAQTALSLVLLVVSGLLLKSSLRLQGVDPGFEPRGLLTVDLLLPDFKYATVEEVEQVTAELLERLRALPGVVDVAAADQVPPFGGFRNDVSRADRPSPTPSDRLPAVRRMVTDGYFRTLGTPILVGRDLQPGDRVGSPPVTVVSRALADKLFPGEDPLGRFLLLPWGDGIRLEIVGVAADVRDFGLADDVDPVFYIPLRQYPRTALRVVVRAAGEPAALVAAVRSAVRDVDKDAPLHNVGTMEEWLDGSLQTPRFASLLVAVFSLIALALAATGLYGVMACLVGERRREIGIRMAVGASPAAVLGWVLRQGMLIAAGGVAVGLVVAAGAARLVRALLFATSAIDPATYVGVAIVLALTALLACLIPASSALRSDPGAVLHSD
jgi:putative ABC transport system permease protein